MRASLILAFAALGCATPNKYYPDAGGEAGDAAAPTLLDAPAAESPVPMPDAAVTSDSSALDAASEQPAGDASVDYDRPPMDMGPPSDTSPPACIRCTDGTCAMLRWDFDSGSLQGAKSGGVFAASPAIATAPPYQGTQSQAMSVPVEFTSAGNSSFASFPICPGTSSVNLRSRTFKARVYLENGMPAAMSPFNLQLYTEDMVEAIVNTFHPAGSWVLLEGQLPVMEDANVTELQLWFGSWMNPSWRGTVWVDDVRIE